MRRLAVLALLPVLPGCIFGGGGESSRVEKVPPELTRPRLVVPPAPDRHALGDLSRLKPGQWATYREGAVTRTISVAAREGDGLWIEVVNEGEPRQVSARLVAPDGTVRRAWYGEIDAAGRPSAAVAQSLEQAASAPAVAPAAEGEVGEEGVVVSGRTLKAVRIRGRQEDLEGRITETVAFWHPEVPPVYAGSAHGGLVRLVSGPLRVDLVAFGADARPLLELSGR